MNKSDRFHKTILTGAGLALAAGLLSAPQTAMAKEFFKMSTLAPGTSVNAVMTTFATTVSANLDDYEIQVNSTGAGTKHILQGARGEIDFFIVSPVLGILLKDRKAMYKKIEDGPQLYQQLRTVFNFPMGIYHIVVYEDSGIKSLKDLKGKRIFLGPPGGAAVRSMSLLIKAVAGLKPGDDFTAVKLGWAAAAQSFQDKQIDAYMVPTNVPNPILSQIALSNKIRLLGIPAELLETDAVKALTRRPGFRFEEIAADAYGANQANGEKVTSLGVTIGLGTRVGISEDVIYTMSKTFWTQMKELQNETPWMRNISLDAVFQDLNMKLHPGAVKYYREIGLDVPAKYSE
jgi:TRAP transporter TAXI family solute receptor